jgi:prepilin-type N-terminal cleavage/methylation domain-containing protein
VRERATGFTLIELLIVIGILGALAAAIVPSLLQSQAAANVELDAAQLRQHFTWLHLYRLQHDDALPAEGGHRFVLATWKVSDQTAEDLDRYFTPGARDNDARYQGLRLQLLRGERIWQDPAAWCEDDTTYAGRAKEHLKTAMQGDQALMANDNDDMWTLSNGTVNVLMSSGHVRTLGYPLLQQIHPHLPDFDVDAPLVTHGDASPIELCRKLAR